jgi:hypothetical protein
VQKFHSSNFGLSFVSFWSASAPWPVARCGMELGNLSPQLVTELKDELAALSKKHVKALHSAIYVGMNEKEADDYDQSRVRISEIHWLLNVSR